MQKWLDEFSLPAGFAGLVVLAGAIGYYFLNTIFDWTVGVLAVLGLLLLAIFIYGNSVALKRSVGGRQLRYGTNAIVMVAALFGILILANVFVARNPKQWDTTAAGDFTLSQQSIKVLANIKDPIHVIGFFSSGDSSEQKARDLLQQYEVRNDKISFEFFDPKLNFAEAQRYEVRDYGMIFLRGARRQEISTIDESSITSALLRVAADKAYRVAFLAGHGEKSITIADDTGFRQAASFLEQNNYQLEPINLLVSPTISLDYSLLIVAGPRTVFRDPEKESIKTYLAGGGRMLYMSDPGSEADLNDIVSKWGLHVGTGVVVDPRSSAQGDLGTVVVQSYLFSPITKDMKGATVLPYSTNVSKTLPAPPGIWYDTLLETTDSGWVEMDTQVAKYDQGTDIKGPIAVGVAVTEQTTAAPGTSPSAASNDHPKLVVFGDSDFVANGFIGYGANVDMLLNSVNWLAQAGQEIAIQPKPITDKTMTLGSGQATFIMLISAVLIPGLVLAAGAAVWWRRR